MADLEQVIAAGRAGKIVVLTGAGVSAESGIPTFRGPEGYWQIGSRNYHPQELATWDAFERMPAEVWAWYLYRRGVCRGARREQLVNGEIARIGARRATPFDKQLLALGR